jgi:hypothetical protein
MDTVSSIKYAMWTHCQLTAMQRDDSTTAVAREQLCRHVVSPTTREHSIMKQMFSVRPVAELYNED